MSKNSEKPNFIVIMTDQQRGDCLGIENPALLTPTLDEMASSGVRFSRGYSSCPSCIAARRSLLTGQFPSTHGMVGFQPKVEFFPEATLPGVLSENGYQSFLVGRSMHQTPARKRYGFDQMILSGDLASVPNQQSHGLTSNGWTARSWHLDECLHPTTRTVDDAVKFLQTWRDPSCPFFLTVSFVAPHPPLCPPAFYMDRYLRMDLPGPVIGDWATPPVEGERGFSVDGDNVNLKGEALRSCLAGYYGLINHVDDQIARLLRAIGKDPITGRRQLDNTVIIFTSDHGEMLGDHYLFRKAYPYEGSARIPFLIRPSSNMQIKERQVINQVVCLEDLMPTILDMAQIEIPDCVEGESLLPVLRGEKKIEREYLHGEHADVYGPHQANHFLTDEREKYIWYSQTGREQLFDLSQDPKEEHDLSSKPEYADTFKKWQQRLIETLKDRPEGFSDGSKLITAEHKAVIQDFV